MADRGEAPHDNRRGEAATHADAVEPATRDQEAERVHQRERVDHGRVLRLGPVELELQRRREDAEDLAVHVVDGGDREQEGADGPSIRGSGTGDWRLVVRHGDFEATFRTRDDYSPRVRWNNRRAAVALASDAEAAARLLHPRLPDVALAQDSGLRGRAPIRLYRDARHPDEHG